MTSNRPGKAKKTTCEKCGGANHSHGNVCTECRVKADAEAYKAPACLLCGKPTMRAFANSFYCLPGCVSAVSKIRQSCMNKVRLAIQSGRLAALDGSVACVDCGAAADRYDHRDYSKPLDVVPVCRGCNKRRGAAKVITAGRLVAAHPQREEVAA